MKNIVHLIGNGNSKSSFIIDGHDVFTCNGGSHDCIATFVHDVKVINWMNECDIDIPIIGKRKRLERFSKKKFYDYIDPSWNEITSGHDGIRYLLSKNYDVINCWGFDSYTCKEMNSDTQERIHGTNLAPPSKIHMWNKRFDELIELSQDCGVQINFMC